MDQLQRRLAGQGLVDGVQMRRSDADASGVPGDLVLFGVVRFDQPGVVRQVAAAGVLRRC